MNKAFSILLSLACILGWSHAESDDYLLSPRNLQLLEPLRIRLQESSVVVVDDKSRSIGYGVVVSASGHLLTKASLIHDLDSYRIRYDRKQFEVELLQESREWDLALLKIPVTDTIPVEFVAVEPQLGDLIVSNGVTSLLKRRHKFGVISANAREIPVKVAALDFITKRVEGEANVVAELVPKGVAESAGLQVGDRITSLDGVTIEPDDVIEVYYQDKWPGDLASLVVEREGQEIELSIPYQWRYKVYPNPMDRNEAMSGRISKRRNGFPRVIQHDIALSARSIGGPLLNLEGKCIGMNIARFSRAETYALPSTVIQKLLQGWL